jgi:SAM-dependent methyltransferase
MYEGILENVNYSKNILDVGCGEGALTFMLSNKSNCITAIDYSKKNIEEAIKRYKNLNLNSIKIMEGDAENIEFNDNSFELVISNHVLEHLPNFQIGLNELYRVTKKEAIIAVPTCFNLCSICLLGGVPYYQFSLKVIPCFIFGIFRIINALIMSEDGVNEGYGVNREQIHIFRFPWVIKRHIFNSGFTIQKIQAQSIRLPFIGLNLNFLRNTFIFKYCGMGTIYILKK